MISELTACIMSAVISVSGGVCIVNAQSQPVLEETSETEQSYFDYDAIRELMPPQPQENSALVGYNDRKSWWFSRNKTNMPPSAQYDINISQYGAYYLGDVSKPVIYLTFDEGYENGCTEQILDTLKKNDVKAAFFVTESYIKSEPELVKRMVDEGHVVGNHSSTHPDFTTISDEAIAEEINSCAEAFKELTGKEMPKFFRPPEGVYSIRTLQKTDELGYKTIFWSLAYRDWVTDDQPGKEAAYESVVGYVHNGCIPLLHAVSQSNADALDSVLKNLKEQGYEFKSLYDLPDFKGEL